MEDDVDKDLHKGEKCENVCIVDFGKVAVRQRRVKTFVVPHTKRESGSYTIERKYNENNENMFLLNTYKGRFDPQRNLNIDFTHCPKLPFKEYVEMFEYRDSCNTVMKLIVKAQSEGPLCQSSMKYLNFFLTPSKQLVNLKFEIRNVSICSAEFKFPINGAHDFFQVTPIEGTIKPSSYKYFFVRFTPREEGFFSHELFCSIRDQEPIVINVFGLYARCDFTKDFKKLKLERFPYKIQQTVGAGAFFRDSLGLDYTPYTLSANFLDFGRVLPCGECKKSETIIFTNNTKDTLSIKWIQDHAAFQIVPKTNYVYPEHSVSFECSFKPYQSHMLYSHSFLVEVYWNSENGFLNDDCALSKVFVPLTTCVRVQGNSFPENEGRITSVSIEPQIIFISPCYPGYSEFTSFKLKNNSHLPVMYRFAPPSKTHILLKPMIGITQSYDIINVLLATDPNIVRTHVEEWKLILNDKNEKPITFYIKGETAIPSIKFDRIHFDNVQVGCHRFVRFPIKNDSVFQLRYEFDTSEVSHYIDINPPTGNLAINETVFTDLTLICHKCIPQETVVKCKIEAVQKLKEVVGEPITHELVITANVVYSQLCAIPDSYDFGHLEYETSRIHSFDIFNFGQSDIYFDIGNYQDIFIQPTYGDVDAGKSAKMYVTLIAGCLGKNTVSVNYRNRVETNSTNIVEEEEPHKLIEYSYECSYAVVQIDDITEHNFGHLFSTVHLRNVLQIERLNAMFREIHADQSKSIDIRLPYCEVGEKQFRVTLAIKNISIFPTTIILRRKKVCDCPLVVTRKTFNTSKKIYDCIHRDLFRMELEDDILAVDSYSVLKIYVKYGLSEVIKMAYTMELSNNRTIDLFFYIQPIPIDSKWIFSYSDFNFSMLNMFIGRYFAPIQAFWLYNNTKHPVSYEVCTGQLEALNAEEGFSVLECLNPSETIKPYSNHPLLIRFHPIELKKYESTIVMCVDGTDNISIPIQGIGINEVEGNWFTVQPREGSNGKSDFPATLSTDVMTVIMPVWSVSERIVFIQNNTKDKIINFFWKNFVLNEILKVEVIEKNGSLLPGDSQPIRITVSTMGEPLIMTLTLQCELQDYTGMVWHNLTLEKYRERQIVLDNEFTITEKGTEAPKENDVTVSPKPEPVTIFLALNLGIIHTKDLEYYMTAETIFKQSPQQYLPINVSNIVNKCACKSTKDPIKMNKEIRDIFGRILEDIIGDVLFRNTFKEMLIMSSRKQSPYYSQYVMDHLLGKNMTNHESKKEANRIKQNEIVKLFHQPRPTLVTETLKTLIYESLCTIFKLPPNVTPNETKNSSMTWQMLDICHEDNCSCEKEKMSLKIAKQKSFS